MNAYLDRARSSVGRHCHRVDRHELAPDPLQFVTDAADDLVGSMTLGGEHDVRRIARGPYSHERGQITRHLDSESATATDEELAGAETPIPIGGELGAVETPSTAGSGVGVTSTAVSGFGAMSAADSGVGVTLVVDSSTGSPEVCTGDLSNLEGAVHVTGGAFVRR